MPYTGACRRKKHSCGVDYRWLLIKSEIFIDYILHSREKISPKTRCTGSFSQLYSCSCSTVLDPQPKTCVHLQAPTHQWLRMISFWRYKFNYILASHIASDNSKKNVVYAGIAYARNELHCCTSIQRHQLL